MTVIARLFRIAPLALSLFGMLAMHYGQTLAAALCFIGVALLAAWQAVT